ncbi:MAG TPA: ABC transporter permease [Thermoanaerobaculia bacterium]|jgi:putative ABC transport system permease protein|nr:ABC transporter permease [Thermoanaerobaculia bacterium]
MSEPARRGIAAQVNLVVEVVAGGLVELWAHKLRSLLTLNLLTLGVFALVVMTSVLDGVMDKVTSGFAGMSWDGTVMVAPKEAKTTEDQKRFAMSPGLRYEDLPRLTAPFPGMAGFVPRAFQSVAVRLPGGSEKVFVTGVDADYARLMNRPIGLGRGLTEADVHRHSTVAVAGATLAAKLFGGADPVGRDVVASGVSFHLVGVQAPEQLFSEENYMDANGLLIPLTTYMDRIDPDHRLAKLGVKLRSKRDIDEVSALLIGRAKQAHHGIEDVEIVDLDAEAARSYQTFLEQLRGWRVVLFSLAGTVLLVGGVGVLSVMLISLADRRYEIGLRKAMGATDPQIFIQFLLEAVVLAALGAAAGTVAGSALCRALGDLFPYGLVVSAPGLAAAWATALLLAVGFGLYPAIRASRLSPMEAMR